MRRRMCSYGSSLLSATLLLILAACGGGGVTIPPPPPPPPPTGPFTNASFSGQYAFLYSGQDTSGGITVAAGSFTADGKGNITGGVQTINSNLCASVLVGDPILASSYSITPDGRGTVNLVTQSCGTFTWKIALDSSPQALHGLLIEFDASTNGGFLTGSGTIDLQNPTTFSTGTPSITGNCVFGVSGIDSFGFPLGLAGGFKALGDGTSSNGIQDINDAGSVTLADNSLSVTYTVTNASTGQGTATFLSTRTSPSPRYIFYLVDNTHLKLVEIDNAASLLNGDVFSAPAVFSSAALNGSYAFTVAGAVAAGAFAGGGVFTAQGNNITSGALDLNDDGTIHSRNLSASTYTSDATTGRGALTLNNGSSTFQYAFYAAANGAVALLQVDGNVVEASGLAFPQTSMQFAAGTYALNFSGVDRSTGFEEDDVGQFTVGANGAVTAGIMDINEAASIVDGVFANVEIETSSVVGPTFTAGRGTATLVPNLSHTPAFHLIVYVIDANSALVLENDSTRVMVGTLLTQH